MNNLMVIDGIEVRRDVYGRYSLNDLHRAAVASGANARTKEPGKFLSSQQTVELVHELTNTQNLGVDPVSVIHGGNERGTYVCKELVYAYAMWIPEHGDCGAAGGCGAVRRPADDGELPYPWSHHSGTVKL